MSVTVHRARPPLHINAAIGFSALLLPAGLLLPAVKTRSFFFFGDTHSLVGAIAEMFSHGSIVLGLACAVFTIVFPLVKTAVLVGGALGMPLKRAVNAVTVLGKWSMLDVFIVGQLLVMSTASWVYSITPLIGIYVFGAHVITSMTASLLLKHHLTNGGAA